MSEGRRTGDGTRRPTLCGRPALASQALLTDAVAADWLTATEAGEI